MKKFGDILKQAVSSQSLKAKSMRGGAALAAGTMIERFARFVRNMILARLLAPNYFGISAIVIACGELFEAFTDVGTGKSIIQSKSGDKAEYLNSVWWFNAGRGAILYACGFLAAPLIAWFYKDASLTVYLRVAFLTMLWNGFVSTGMYAKQRDLKFGTTVWITQGCGFLGTLTTLALVIFMRNVWVLIIGLVCEGLFRLILSFILCPIRPHLPIDKDAWKDLSRFSRGMAGLPILLFVVMQADVFVLGKLVGKDVLGTYYLALSLANIPMMIFNKIANPLLLPVFSRFQDDSQKLSDYLLKITKLIWLFGLPFAACMAAYSGSVLTLIYGQRYASMAVPFSILSFYFIFYMAGTPMSAIYMAVGNPALHRNFSILRLLLVVSSIYPAVYFLGPTGAPIALLASLALATVLQVRNMGKIIHLPMLKYYGTMLGGLVACAAVLAVGLAYRLAPRTPLWLDIAACASSGALAWLLGFLRERANIRSVANTKKGDAANDGQ